MPTKSNTALRYPLEISNATDVDYVSIQGFEYRPNRGGTSGFGGTAFANGGSPPASIPPILLYMPNSLSPTNNPQNWGAKSFSGPLGALVRAWIWI